MPNIKLTKKIATSAAFVASKKAKTFLMLSRSIRPSLIASTMVSNRSSSSTRSDASLAISLPLPIATPISALFNATASLTPSPVIATTCPCRCKAFITRCLSIGVARAITVVLLSTSINSLSVIFCTSSLVSSVSSVSIMPTSLATDFAVSKWSPVIKITLIPALRAC